MNQQQMTKAYEDIFQFQLQRHQVEMFTLKHLLEEFIPILDLPFDPQKFNEKQHEATKNQSTSIYYVKSNRDSRCLLLVEFRNYEWDTMIIRFAQRHEQKIREILEPKVKIRLENRISDQSMMNRIVKEYQLDIDIVDEYDIWNTVFHQRSFWNEYAQLSSGDIAMEEMRIYPELVEPIRLEIQPGTELLLYLGDELFGVSLYLQHPTLEQPVELGWDDAAQWYPHVLRWQEFEDITLYLTIRYPDHFVIPFLLLVRFALITEEENESMIARQIKAAWRSLSLFHEEEIEQFDEMAAYAPHFTWSYDAERQRYHACDSPDDIYSMRHICTDHFPFDPFDQVMNLIHTYRDTTEWQIAQQKWEKLIQQYSTSEDEGWFMRRDTYVHS